jgi:hypothetical protein
MTPPNAAYAHEDKTKKENKYQREKGGKNKHGFTRHSAAPAPNPRNC